MVLHDRDEREFAQDSDYSTELSESATFCEFVCYFNICKKSNSERVTVDQIKRLFNQDLKYGLKKRCII